MLYGTSENFNGGDGEITEFTHGGAEAGAHELSLGNVYGLTLGDGSNRLSLGGDGGDDAMASGGNRLSLGGDGEGMSPSFDGDGGEASNTPWQDVAA